MSEKHQSKKSEHEHPDHPPPPPPPPPDNDTQTVVVAPSVKLLTLTNTFPHYLVQRATAVTGPWTTIYTGTNGAATIEVWDSSGDPMAFYRVTAAP